MPVYAYKCKNCAHQFDIRQSFTDEPLKVCPECDGDLRKQFNTVGVVFKGSGFYRNDSRAGGTESKGASSSSSASGSASAASGSESSSSGSSSSESSTSGSASSAASR